MKRIWGLAPASHLHDTAHHSAFTRGLLLLMHFKWLPVAGALAGLVFAVIYLLTATPLYTARMVLGPAETSGGISGAGGGLRAELGALTGTSVGSSVDPYALFNELSTSATTAQRLYDQNVLQMLMPVSWDASTASWQRPSGGLTSVTGFAREIFGRPAWAPPDVETVEQIIKSGVSSRSDNGSAYFRIYEYKNSDPKKAVRFLQLLYDAADAEARMAALSRADALSQYLQTKLTTVTEPEYRAALYQSLAQQEVTRIMGRSHAAFAAQMIDPPRASRTPTDPPLFQTLVTGILLGAIMGVFAAYFLSWLAMRTAQRPESA